jgi:hypothetical protein
MAPHSAQREPLDNNQQLFIIRNASGLCVALVNKLGWVVRGGFVGYVGFI